MHTFQNSEANNPNGTPNWKKRELVTRLTNEVGSRLSANCDKAGDLLCDTEADPFGVEGYSVNSCVVTAPLDANGDTYRPNMGNYMNYNWCPDYNFTKQQVAKMSDGYTLMNSKTKFFTAPETSQPAPSNPVANVGTYNGDVTLRWKDNSNLETGYIIEVAEVGTNNFVPVGGVKANTTSFKLGKLNAGTEYVFRVKPSNSKQNYSTVSESFKIPTLCAATNSKICGKEEEPAYVINNVELSKGKTKLLSNPNSGCAGSATVNFLIRIKPK